MSFLHLALNQTNSDCYQYDSGLYLEDKVIQKLAKIKSKFPILHDYIAEMLQTKEELRPDFIQLHTKFERNRQNYPT